MARAARCNYRVAAAAVSSALFVGPQRWRQRVSRPPALLLAAADDSLAWRLGPDPEDVGGPRTQAAPPGRLGTRRQCYFGLSAPLAAAHRLLAASALVCAMVCGTRTSTFGAIAAVERRKRCELDLALVAMSALASSGGNSGLLRSLPGSRAAGV